ncbi:MAG TPA: response regulator [Caldithrix abyssi]|uniref:Response regulator n=1 Tax=Caldithrix abyssi TaxID=187145 RepID=A0A7V5RNI1_CALAY|nr:response regulator [Caldithrix abyssi]
MKKILFVDDDPNMHRMVELFLRSAGVELIFAGNGRSAIKHMENHRFDLIFSDIQMPEMDGITLLKHLREKGDATPFVIVSAFGQESVAEKALALGASDIVNKPFDRETLLAKIRKTE